MSRYLIRVAAFALGALAQSSSPYTDSSLGISFCGYAHTNGFRFGLALPQSPESDFIGQIVAPLTDGAGYAGVSLGGGMVNPLLVVVYPNGEEVTASLRSAAGYSNPTVYSGSGSPTLEPIAAGTSVNTTHLMYTFLCKGCILGGSLTFEPTVESTVLGWALGSTAVSTPSSASATLTYHDKGFGQFGMALTDAKSADYAKWAAMVSTAPVEGGNGGNSTGCTGTPSNVTTTISNTTYDYIVAGAGPAGIIVAQRLAESGKSVLLLERGKASTYASGGRSLVPWSSTVTQYDVPALSYYLTTAADTSEYCTDTASQAGCLLGGGTMVNALMFVRPQDKDFSRWPVGWKAEDVSPAASRLYERNPGTTLASEDGQRYDQAAFKPISGFLESIGFKQTDAIQSPNDKHQAYTFPPWDVQDGKRGGPVNSYLPLAKALPNFELQLETKVIRAVRNGTHIAGVEVETRNSTRQIIKVKPNGKVILASGAMSTPRVLFNSGIGPADQLSTVASGCSGVTLPSQDQWIHLPVGEGIKDHPIFTLPFKFFNNGTNLTSLAAADFTSPSATNIELFAQGSGPLAQSGQRLNFWTSITTNGTERFFQGTCAPSAGGFKIKLYLTHGASSSGTLGIDANGNTQLTKPPLMTTSEDKAAVASFIDSFLASTRNSSTIAYAGKANDTGASLSADFVSGTHFVGSAKMGTDDGRTNGTSVVDLDTKVYGTDNLFVVDASMHPDLPTGNTQAIVMVGAEAAAERILALDGLSIAASNTTANGTETGRPFKIIGRRVRQPLRMPFHN